jgi:histidinol phosphatase-like PHP family hydrolase
MKLKQSLGAGKVLTLSPVYPLEGGLYIYPALATGPFAWRTSNLISDEQRNRYNILSEVNLNAKMVNDPPVAILVGLERNIEDPLISYAKTNGYEFNYFLDSIHLWVK